MERQVEPGMETPEEHDEEEEEFLLVSLAELIEDFPLSLLLVATIFFGDLDLERKNLAIFLALLLLGDFPFVSDICMGITTGERDCWVGEVASLPGEVVEL
jgi:hypothetical protein